MKRIFLLAIIAAVLAVCGLQAKAGCRAQLAPMFVGSLDDNVVMVYYWESIEEPQSCAHGSCTGTCAERTPQEALRSNPRAYTHLIMEDGTEAPISVARSLPPSRGKMA